MAEERSDEIGDLAVTQTNPNNFDGKCSCCETMSKNLEYLENYLSNYTAKNSCNSCSTSLSFLLYMKQQTVPVPRFDPTNEVVYRTILPGNTPIASSEYTIQETITYQSASNAEGPQIEKKPHASKKPQLKSVSSGKKGKVIFAAAGNKHEKTCSQATKHAVVGGKNNLNDSSGQSTSKPSTNTKQSTSSRGSTGSKSKPKKPATVKVSLGKASSAKATKVKPRTVGKSVKRTA